MTVTGTLIDAKMRVKRLLNSISSQPAKSVSLSPEEVDKKRIIIITSNGGGGHMSASRAIQNAVAGLDYVVRVITPCDNIPGGDDLFNKYMKKGDFSTIKMLIQLQKVADVDFTAAVAWSIEQELIAFEPHLVISVMPIANYETHHLTRKRNIPFLVVPTDVKFDHFFNFFNKPTLEDLKIAIPFDDISIKDLVKKNKFSVNNFTVTGYPLRPEFGSPAEELRPEYDVICKELAISAQDRVVVIMMGAQGSMKDTLNYVRRIRKHAKKVASPKDDRSLWKRFCLRIRGKLVIKREKVHILVMCGENEELRERIKGEMNEKIAKYVNLHPLGKKNGTQVAALLRFADVFVTKPGGSSVNEVLASEIFSLFDYRSAKYIKWENVNLEYACKKGCGERINKKHFTKQLRRALDRPERPKVESCPGRNFNSNMRALITNLMQ
jgi:UDP-N-acetylglucosamine:LPS N-acetylglucosamine transferase